jgi:asparagine synthase (glutamine-hydrolysing)
VSPWSAIEQSSCGQKKEGRIPMCGILGFIGDSGNEVNATAALSSLRHRGPNDSGLWESNSRDLNVLLGQTLLSIIDLTYNGHQPMISPDGRFIVVFNGEIYNYKKLRGELVGYGCEFRGESDTEVLLTTWRVWGAESLTKLKGMFVFAILDLFNNTLICCRDAFGIKPFFYHLTSASFSFASEIQALRELGEVSWEIDQQQSFNYLVRGEYDETARTFVKDIQRLEPGHMLTIDFSKDALTSTLIRWWLPETKERSLISFQDATELVREEFLGNIRIHLRSDVRLGAALSGGIDSSAIVCAMRHVEPDMDIDTFSYIATGARAHKVEITADQLAKDLDDLIRAQGEPFGSSSIYAQYLIYKEFKHNEVIVALDGQGADELFAGYLGYPQWRIRSLLNSMQFSEAAKFARHWSEGPDRSRLELLRLVVRNYGSNYSLSRFPFVKRPQKTPLWISRNKLLDYGVDEKRMKVSLEKLSSNRALIYQLLESLSGGELGVFLRHGDRNSMRWSVESRVHFLTTELAEIVLGLPERYLISPEGETKSIFRAAMKGIVPDEILARRDKVGFETPEIQWLRTIQPTIETWMQGLEAFPWIDIDEARRYVHDSLNRNGSYSNSVWRLINAARWADLTFAA